MGAREDTFAATEVLTGAEIVVRCLELEQVRHIFGYPGGSVLHIYDALFDRAQHEDGIRHVLVRHEQAAVHAADAYSRSSRQVGVALVTSGPGATNAVTGIATAYLDSIPLVVITGQVPLKAIGQDAFQECDTIGITRSCVKHNFLVRDVRDLAETFKKAFYIARSGRPGPVVIDIPKDITTESCKFAYPAKVEMRSYRPPEEGHGGQIRKALEALLSAERPLIYAGGGVVLADAAPELNQLVNRLDYPCTNTLMGLGGFQGSSPRFLGMLGLHGTYEANMAMQHCDVLIAIGARFDDRVIGNPEHFASRPRRIIHIDIDASSISKRVKVGMPIVGNIRHVLREMLALLDAQPTRRLPDISDWWRQITQWRNTNCLHYQASDSIIKPQYVIEQLWEVTRGDAYITSDVGQHQMWAAQYYKFDQPRRWINSGGLGTMGVGLPYAMGVQLANPGATVACVTGEGSIQMCIQELATCKQYRLTPKIIMLNNRSLGMVRQLQDVYSGARYAESYMNALPDFDKLAASFGHVGVTVTSSADVDGALRDAFAMKDKLVFMNFITDQDESVWPMIESGKGLDEMLMGAGDLPSHTSFD